MITATFNLMITVSHYVLHNEHTSSESKEVVIKAKSMAELFQKFNEKCTKINLSYEESSVKIKVLSVSFV